MPIGFTFFETLISLLLISLMLVGLDVTQITALKAEKTAYYSTVATQQLTNFIYRLQALKGENPNAQLQFWNQQNAMLLPQGQGAISGSYPSYQLTIKWGKTINCQQTTTSLSGCISTSVSFS